MEATEIAEHIHEHGTGHHHLSVDAFRRLAAVYLGVTAMLLAIATLGGGNATKEMLSANIHASDTYAFYQAKYLRQIYLQTTADLLEMQMSAGTLPAVETTKATALVKRYRDTAARYESEPATGDGKKELLAKAKEWEAIRAHATAQNPNFEFAEALFQIAIVLGSVAIVAGSWWLLGLSGILSILASLLTVNGFFLLVQLPHH